MTDINTVSLLQQMRSLAVQAQGGSVEFQNTTAPTQQFSSILTDAMGKVNQLNTQADGLRTRFELGDSQVSLADVMVAAQKSTLAFEATVRVRNKLVQAYQDIMNMPV